MAIQQLIQPQQNSLIDTLMLVQQMKSQRAQSRLSDLQFRKAERDERVQNELRAEFNRGGDIASPEFQRRVIAIDPATGISLVKQVQQQRKATAEESTALATAAEKDLEFVARFPGNRPAVMAALNKWGERIPNIKAVAAQIGAIQDPAEFAAQVQNFAMSTKDQMQEARMQQAQAIQQQQFQQAEAGRFARSGARDAAMIAAARAGAGVQAAQALSPEEQAVMGEGQYYKTAKGEIKAVPGPTVAQSRAELLAPSATAALTGMKALIKSYSPSGLKAMWDKYAVAGGPTGFFASSEGQQYQVYAKELVANLGYGKSGANLTEQEWEVGRETYIPQPWNSREVVQQKLKALSIGVQGLESGRRSRGGAPVAPGVQVEPGAELPSREEILAEMKRRGLTP